MSLVVITRFNNGIIFASDSFVFDNDGELPLKHLNFEKFYFPKKIHAIFVSTGSSWVFNEFSHWFEGIDSYELTEEIKRNLTKKWKDLNKTWKNKYKQELSKLGVKTLRPISNSTLFCGFANKKDSICIIDSSGEWNVTSSFVLSGSGSSIVEKYLRTTNQMFRSHDTITKSLSLVWKCYSIASKDLYVTGYPTVALINHGKIINLSQKSEQVWLRHLKKYFKDLEHCIENSIETTY